METELSDQADAHAMESGFFNKYAIDETDPRKGDPADPKTVIFFSITNSCLITTNFKNWFRKNGFI